MKPNTVLRAALLPLLMASAFTSAEEQLARLTLDVTINGSKAWKNGSDYSNSKISEQYHIVTHVKTSGEPTNVNTKDPQFA